MKKLMYLFVFSLVFVSCGGDDGDDTTPEPPVSENKAPNTPAQIAPTNNLLCIDNSVLFEWTAATDPEGDAVSYELQIATNTAFSENAVMRTSSDTTISVLLEKGVAYYWRVKSTDAKNASSEYSSTYSFYTEGDGKSNHLPFAPALEAPILQSIIQESSVVLKWTASDVDNDPLLFDVYVGLSNPPTSKVAEDISDVSFHLDLESSKYYYWKVVVKDDKGGVTTGQVWGFKTD